MKRLTLAIITSLGFAVVGLSASAQTSTAKSDPPANNGKSWGKPDIDSMCDSPTDTPKPKDGYQYDGAKASEEVMTMAFGMYRYPNGGGLLFWPDERYLIKLPSTSTGIYGTDGDDLLAGGGIVGGCSKEQLSEAIARNKLDFDQLQLSKAYK